jgi:hypothetical protein
MIRRLATIAMIVGLIAPAIAGPARALRPGTVITNVENLTSYRYIDDSAGNATGLRLDGFKLRYGRAGIRIGGDASDIVIRNGVCTTKGVNKGSDLPVCIDLRGTVHDVLVEGVTASDHRMISVPGKYTNGDGFSTEQGTRNITFRLSTSKANSDGGFDLKGQGHTLDRTVAESNGRNYRFWETGKATAIVSRDPRGSDIWTGTDKYAVNWTIDGATFERTTGGLAPVVSGEGNVARLTLTNCTFRGFSPGVAMKKGKVTIIADASCQPDAKGYVVNTPVPIAAAALPGIDLGEVLPDTNDDGRIALSNKKADQHKLPRGTVLRLLGGTRYEIVR